MRYGDLPKLGAPFGGPHNKDFCISGSILGSLSFWETTLSGPGEKYYPKRLVVTSRGVESFRKLLGNAAVQCKVGLRIEGLRI